LSTIALATLKSLNTVAAPTLLIFFNTVSLSYQNQTIFIMKNFLFLITFLFISVIRLNAQDNAVRQKHYNLDKNELALDGYDAISYFTAKKPVEGNTKWSYKYKGVNYRFSSKANKNEFAKNPAKYEPAYGGWCTYAMAKDGEKVSVDPLTYKISDGKLLLFYKTAFKNTLSIWNKDKKPEVERLKKGDQYWKEIIE